MPKGDPRHDIGHEKEAAILRSLVDTFGLPRHAPELKGDRVRIVAQFIACSVRALLWELGVAEDMARVGEVGPTAPVPTPPGALAVRALEQAAMQTDTAKLREVADAIEREWGVCEAQWLRTVANNYDRLREARQDEEKSDG